MTVTVGHRVGARSSTPTPPWRDTEQCLADSGGPGEITFRGQSGGYKQLWLGDKQAPWVPRARAELSCGPRAPADPERLTEGPAQSSFPPGQMVTWAQLSAFPKGLWVSLDFI